MADDGSQCSQGRAHSLRPAPELVNEPEYLSHVREAAERDGGAARLIVIRQAWEVSFPTLRWARRDQPGMHRVALESEEVMIGQRPGYSIRVEGDSQVSRDHARVWCAQGAWLVEDLKSTNGTFLRRADGVEQRLRGPHTLRHGDRLRVGRTVLIFDALEAVDEMVPTELADGQAVISPTPKEREVLQVLCASLLAGGDDVPQVKEIAQRLVLSTDTIHSHLKSLYAKFDVGEGDKKLRLAYRAVERGWVDDQG